jgi:glycosyltransferase involved in cell wall biosynthesis
MSAAIKPRIFFECTRTWRSSLHTGIERVVRNIIEASQEVGRSLDVLCQPVVYRPLHGFVTIEPRDISRDKPAASKPAQSLLKRQLQQWGLAPIARSCRHQIQSASNGIQSIFQPFSKTRLGFLPEDILILLDSSWTTPYWSEIRRAQEHGTLVGAMLYDLLPMQFPNSFTRHQRRHFHLWWDKAYHQADFVTSISESVCRDVFEYHKALETRPAKLPGGAFRLGADFLDGHSGAPVRRELSALQTQPVYLSVGTLSPRKQQALILDAFERLWSRGINASLLYAGGNGWGSEAFIHRLRNHPEWGKSLFWRADLNDAELDWCYEHAAGLITASLGEGFNLPIVEALHKRCPVFASDIPVHREVGGGFASYFPKDDPIPLAGQIKRHCLAGTLDNQTPIDRFHWPNWNTSCAELIQLIQNLAQQCRNTEQRNQTRAA